MTWHWRDRVIFLPSWYLLLIAYVNAFSPPLRSGESLIPFMLILRKSCMQQWASSVQRRKLLMFQKAPSIYWGDSMDEDFRFWYSPTGWPSDLNKPPHSVCEIYDSCMVKESKEVTKVPNAVVKAWTVWKWPWGCDPSKTKMGAHQLSYLSVLKFTAVKVKFYATCTDSQEGAFLSFAGWFPHSPTGFALVVSLWAEWRPRSLKWRPEVFKHAAFPVIVTGQEVLVSSVPGRRGGPKQEVWRWFRGNDMEILDPQFLSN